MYVYYLVRLTIWDFSKFHMCKVNFEISCEPSEMFCNKAHRNGLESQETEVPSDIEIFEWIRKGRVLDLWNGFRSWRLLGLTKPVKKKDGSNEKMWVFQFLILFMWNHRQSLSKSMSTWTQNDIEKILTAWQDLGNAVKTISTLCRQNLAERFLRSI